MTADRNRGLTAFRRLYRVPRMELDINGISLLGRERIELARDKFSLLEEKANFFNDQKAALEKQLDVESTKYKDLQAENRQLESDLQQA